MVTDREKGWQHGAGGQLGELVQKHALGGAGEEKHVHHASLEHPLRGLISVLGGKDIDECVGGVQPEESARASRACSDHEGHAAVEGGGAVGGELEDIQVEQAVGIGIGAVNGGLQAVRGAVLGNTVETLHVVEGDIHSNGLGAPRL